MRSKYQTTPEAVRFWTEGGLCLSEMSSYGVRVDKGYLDQTIIDTEKKIKDLEAQLRSDEVYRVWRRRFADKTNLASPKQASEVFFKVLGYKTDVMTDGGDRESASERALESVDIPFAKNYLLAGKLRKLNETYLHGIRREMVYHPDGYWLVHPHYHLNSVVTFRSSCSDPNWQNIYKRNPEFAEIIRRAYIPRRGRQFVELDYVGAEVKICACYTLDPTAIAECNDKTKDPHRDAAARLFMLRPEQVTKEARFAAKSFFVFAQFYGDYYVNCARNLWTQIQKLTVKDSDKTMLEHLAEQGITERGDCEPGQKTRPGTYEAHVRDVEDWYWNKKYKVHAQWKKDWWEAYQTDGGFMMNTGFAVNLDLGRNEVINSPIQGSSFHCLLWSDIQKAKLLRKYKMASRLVGEIHDCDVAEVDPRERDDYIEMSRQVMTRDVRRHWPWIVVPLELDVELCQPDASWFDKKTAEFSDGVWTIG